MGRVLQVVGYQNSGKTTFVVNLVKKLANNGLKVGTIKHHGHEGKLKSNDQKKDTGRHRDAGALVSAVEGNGAIMLNTKALSLSLPQLLKLYSQFQLELIVVEGYKYEPYPKVVLIRSEKDIKLLDDLSNICCVVTKLELSNEKINKYIVFEHMDDAIEWIVINKVGESIE